MKNERLGKAIKLKRKEIKLTMRELANRIGVDRTYISKIESQNLTPAYHVLVKLETALGIDLKPFYFKKKGVDDAVVISPTGKPATIGLGFNTSSDIAARERRPSLPIAAINLKKTFPTLESTLLAQFISSNMSSPHSERARSQYEDLLKKICPTKAQDNRLFFQVSNMMKEMQNERDLYRSKFIEQTKRIESLITSHTTAIEQPPQT